MQLTDLLSDLNSLRACDPDAALKLVSLRPSQVTETSSPQTDPAGPKSQSQNLDPDLARPGILLHLHRTVKLAYTLPSSSSVGSSLKDLHKAREDVREILTSLGPGIRTHGNVHAPPETPNMADSLNDADDEEVAAWS